MGAVIDLFCGGGGASVAIRQALGRPVDIAVDFNPAALAIHKANHPEAEHVLGDLAELDPAKTAPADVDLLWASPPCVGFSPARGGRQIDPATIALPWVAVRWAEALRPRLIAGENVAGMVKWPEFPAWSAALTRLGYGFDWSIVSACDYGAPTIRTRLFFLARSGGRPPKWPRPDHGPCAGRRYNAARGCLDLGLPMFPADASFFYAAKIRRRLAKLDRPSLFSGGPGSGHFIFQRTIGGHVKSIDHPMMTITASFNLYLFRASEGGPTLIRPVLADEARRAQGLPDGFKLEAFGDDGKPVSKAAQWAAIGNSVSPPPAAALLRANLDALA